jgi:putative oxidoreductase
MTFTANGNPGALPLIGRILVATIFIIAGLGKLAAPGPTQGHIASVGLPLPSLAYVVAILVELGGGLLLLVGYRTRIVAAVLAVFCVVTALVFHHALADRNQMIHFLKNLAMAGGLLQFVAFGPGRIGWDSRAGTSA